MLSFIHRRFDKAVIGTAPLPTGAAAVNADAPNRNRQIRRR
jgi:hypothetical protein